MEVFRNNLLNSLHAIPTSDITYPIFEGMYLKILDIDAPFKQKYVRGNDQPFMTKSLCKAIMVRTKLKNIYYRLPTDENLRIFKKQRNYCVKLLNKTKRNFYENINISKITDNRKFWKNIKPFFSNKIISASNFILYENDEIIRRVKWLRN